MVIEARTGVLDLCRRAIQLAEADGATQAEALVQRSDQQLTRFANSEVHQNVAEVDTTVSLRFVDGKRIGVASTNRTDDASLRRLAESAARICRVQPEQPDFGGLPEPGAEPVTAVAGASSPSTVEATPERRAEGARAAISAADAAGVLAYGSYRTVTEHVAVANSLGIACEEERSLGHVVIVAMGPDGEAGYAEAAAVDIDDLDPGALGREAAAKAATSRGAVAIEPGDYPVVLEEYAVVDLLDMLGYLGFSALAVQEGRSFFEPGKRIGSDLVTIRDDPADPEGTPATFDYEGVTKKPITLVDRGICREVVYDAQTASREGRRSTGHGLPAPNPWGPFPLNQIMDAGDTPRDALVEGLERGLLVTRFHYTNVVHPKLAMITGMTRDGLFLVEAGRIVGPVRNLRFTQSYLEALARVEAVGRDRRLLRGFLGSVVVPAIRISAFTFTGATEH
ncbi:MAG: TldD/PmbA family protein [Chloroflexi bacterium]|nr:TldD/PmbA family protein [Chloroflexota bacterium]